MKRTLLALVLLLALLAGAFPVQAELIWDPNIGWYSDRTPIKATPEEQFQMGQDLENSGNVNQAMKAYLVLLDFWPDSPMAGKAAARGANCAIQLGHHWRAYKAIEKCLAKNPKTENVGELVALEYKIGKIFSSGIKREFVFMRILSGYEAAIKVFTSVLEHDPFGEYGDAAQLGLGQAYFNKRKYSDAIKAFNTLIEKYPESQLIEEGRKQLAMAHLAQSCRAAYSLESMSKAEEIFKDRLAELEGQGESANPDEIAHIKELLVKIKRIQAQQSYQIANYYERRHRFGGAKTYYEQLVADERFRDTEWYVKAHKKLPIIRQKYEKQQVKLKAKADRKKKSKDAKDEKKYGKSKAQIAQEAEKAKAEQEKTEKAKLDDKKGKTEPAPTVPAPSEQKPAPDKAPAPDQKQK